MTPTEKLLLAGYAVVSSIAIHYIRKCNRLEKQNYIMQDSIDIMKNYIEREEFNDRNRAENQL